MRVLSCTRREGEGREGGGGKGLMCLLGERGKESTCTHPSAVKFKYFTCTCTGGPIYKND